MNDPHAGRRVAICVLADTDHYTDLMTRLHEEDVAMSVLAARPLQKEGGDGPESDSCATGIASDWATFLEIIRRGTTPAVAKRLGLELTAGRRLLMIALSDVDQESRILSEILAGGALSVQVHELSA